MEKGRKKKPLPTRRTMIVAFVLTALFAAMAMPPLAVHFSEKRGSIQVEGTVVDMERSRSLRQNKNEGYYNSYDQFPVYEFTYGGEGLRLTGDARGDVEIGETRSLYYWPETGLVIAKGDARRLVLSAVMGLAACCAFVTGTRAAWLRRDMEENKPSKAKGRIFRILILTGVVCIVFVILLVTTELRYIWTGVQVRAQVQYPDGDGRGASVTFQWKDKEKGVHAVTSPFSLLPKSYYRGDKLIIYYNTGWQQGHIPANRGLVWTGALGGSAAGIITLSWGVWGLTRQKRRQKS